MKTLTKVSAVLLIAPFVSVLGGAIIAFAASPAAVNLGTAGNFAILAKTGVSTTGSTAVIGDIGLSPAAASYLTGFALTLPAASASSTSAQVTGKIYAPGYADPTSATLTTAVLNMQNAYTDGMSRAADVSELGAGNIGGLTLVPGVYKWSTNVTIPTNITLSGGANDVWIFEIAQNLTISPATNIMLSGGAQASNIFWVVAGQTTIGTTAVFNGNILDQTAIVLNTGAQLNGRALAQSAVTLDSNTVTEPVSNASTPAVSVTPVVTSTTVIPATTSTGSSASPVVTAVSATAALTSQQQQQYNQLVSIGVNSSVALNAVNQIAPNQSSMPAASAPASSFSQQVRAIATSLTLGSSNSNVTALQQFLISQNRGSAAEALSAVGATGYFGALTRTALAEFQAKVGISPALGNFGPVTRAYLSSH